MTTYPLSEPATIYSVDASGDATSDVLGQGTLEDCVAIAGELLHFLREESAGLSNNEIIEIKSSDP